MEQYELPDVPSNWAKVDLSELVASTGIFSDGDWVESKDQDPNGEVRLVQLADIGELAFTDRSDRWLTKIKADDLRCLYLEKGDILISRLGDPLGKACIYPGSDHAAVTVVDVCVLRIGHNSVDSRLLVYFINSPYMRAQIETHAGGTTRKRITGAKLKKTNILLPPLAEQKRIVDKIERLFSYLDEGERLLVQVKRQISTYRQAVLKAAVTGELTKEWRATNRNKVESGKELLQRILEERRKSWQGRGKYQEPLTSDTSSLPDLPEGWTWASLNQLGEFGRGKSKHRPRNDPALFHEGTFPFLQTGEVRGSKGNISKFDRCYNEFGLAQSKLWPIGTLCITIAANIAETGILGISACFPDSVVGLVAADGISAQYVDYFMRTARENLNRYAPATAQKNINLDILQKVGVPLPPKEEQDEITNHVGKIFDALDELERTLETENTRSLSLRQRILKAAFSGELVNQDPNDEPASKLLARIHEEQKQAKASNPQGSRISKRSASV